MYKKYDLLIADGDGSGADTVLKNATADQVKEYIKKNKVPNHLIYIVDSKTKKLTRLDEENSSLEKVIQSIFEEIEEVEEITFYGKKYTVENMSYDMDDLESAESKEEVWFNFEITDEAGKTVERNIDLEEIEEMISNGGLELKRPHAFKTAVMDLESKFEIKEDPEYGQIAALRNVLDAADIEKLYPNYSGRGMYGSKCFGIVVSRREVDNVKDICDEWGIEPRVDNLGLSYIVYWPNFTIAEVEEELGMDYLMNFDGFEGDEEDEDEDIEESSSPAKFTDKDEFFKAVPDKSTTTLLNGVTLYKLNGKPVAAWVRKKQVGIVHLGFKGSGLDLLDLLKSSFDNSVLEEKEEEVFLADSVEDAIKKIKEWVKDKPSLKKNAYTINNSGKNMGHTVISLTPRLQKAGGLSPGKIYFNGKEVGSVVNDKQSKNEDLTANSILDSLTLCEEGPHWSDPYQQSEGHQIYYKGKAYRIDKIKGDKAFLVELMKEWEKQQPKKMWVSMKDKAWEEVEDASDFDMDPAGGYGSKSHESLTEFNFSEDSKSSSSDKIIEKEAKLLIDKLVKELRVKTSTSGSKTKLNLSEVRQVLKSNGFNKGVKEDDEDYLIFFTKKLKNGYELELTYSTDDGGISCYLVNDDSGSEVELLA